MKMRMMMLLMTPLQQRAPRLKNSSSSSSRQCHRHLPQHQWQRAAAVALGSPVTRARGGRLPHLRQLGQQTGLHKHQVGVRVELLRGVGNGACGGARGRGEVISGVLTTPYAAPTQDGQHPPPRGPRPTLGHWPQQTEQPQHRAPEPGKRWKVPSTADLLARYC
jgi:hypothetical protein